MDQSDIRQVLRALRSATPNVAANSDLLRRIDDYDRANQVRQREFYVVLNTSAALAAAATQGPLTVTFNDDFMLLARSYFADVAGAVQTDSSRVVPLVTVTMTEQGSSGGAFQDNAAPISSLFGPGADKPYVLPVPKFFKAKTTLSVSLTNFSAATSYATIRLVFHGVQLFASPGGSSDGAYLR